MLLACVAGAIGEYLRDQGDDPDGKEIRAMVPVNLRPLEKAWQLGNRFGLAPLVLPIGIANPIERVYAVRRRMNELKGSYQPLLAFAVLAVAGLLDQAGAGRAARPVREEGDRGDDQRAGPGDAAEVLRLDACARRCSGCRQSGDIGVGVSILCYGGGVQFGLITDTQLCPDPQEIIERFEPEFEKLLLVTLMLPWGEAA